MKRKRLFIWMLFYLSISIGCGFGEVDKRKSDMINMNEIKEIAYWFIDASVPPQYHRSYAIKVTTTKAHIVVDSYGKMLAEKDYKISNTQFNDLLNLFKKNKIKNCMLNGGNGCTGGTSEKISLYDGNKEVFSGLVYHCGREDYGNLCGNIHKFSVKVKKLVPDLGELVK